jgi:hypothetical protein
MPDNFDSGAAEPTPRTPPPGFVAGPAEDLVFENVRGTIWGKGPVEHANVTAQLNRKLVAKFVAFEMNGLPAARFWRVRILADLYYLTELLGTVEGLIDRNGSGPESLERSVVCTIILYEVGDQAGRARALEYYQGLVANAGAGAVLEALTECLGVVGLGVPPEPLQRRFGIRMQQLAERAAADPDSGMEMRALEGVLENEFFLIRASNMARQRLGAFTEPAPLINELIRVYLDLTDDLGAQYLSLWVTRTLRRLAGQDAATVIAGLRHNAAAAASFPAEDSIFCRVRCYNAIEFFGGFLDAAETAFMAKHRNNQRDVLAPVPIHLPVAEVVEDDEE